MPIVKDASGPEAEETGRAPLHSKSPEYSAAVAKDVRRENKLRRESIFEKGTTGEVAAVLASISASLLHLSGSRSSK